MSTRASFAFFLAPSTAPATSEPTGATAARSRRRLRLVNELEPLFATAEEPTLTTDEDTGSAPPDPPDDPPPPEPK